MLKMKYSAPRGRQSRGPWKILISSAVLFALGVVLSVASVAELLTWMAKHDAPAWVQAIGSLLAILAAIWIGNRQHRHAMQMLSIEDNRRRAEEQERRRAVASAVLREMYQAVNASSEAFKILDAASKHVAEAHPSLRFANLQRMRPMERKVWQSMGAALGSLSGNAMSHAVAFDGACQMLERAFEDSIVGAPSDPATIWACKGLRVAIQGFAWAIEPNIVAVAEDAGEIHSRELAGILAALRATK